MQTQVFRAPMRSRDDDVPVGIAVERALDEALCGLGGRLDTPPGSMHDAIIRTDEIYGERAARRLERFADAPQGSFVWSRDAYEHLWLGRIGGDWSYDTDPAAWAVDLVHVRPCSWIPTPISHDEAPPSVSSTFGRGGRNWQRIRNVDASPDTERIWSRYDSGTDQVTRTVG